MTETLGDTSLMMSPGLADILDMGEAEVRPRATPIAPPAIDCVISAEGGTVAGTLVSLATGPDGFDVTVLAGLEFIQEALEVTEFRTIEITNGDKSMHSREIQAGWSQSREVRPQGPSFLMVLSVRRGG